MWRCAAWVAAGFVALASWNSWGAAETVPAAPVKDEPVLVMVYNRPVVIFRAGLYGYSAQRRADEVRVRLNTLIAEFPAGEIGTRASADGTIITIAGHRAFMITPADLDPVADQTIEQYTQEVTRRLTEVMTARRRQHELPFIIRSAGVAAGATLLYGLAVWLLWRVQRWLLPRANGLVNWCSTRLFQSGFNILGHLTVLVFWTVRTIVWLFILLVTYSWLTFCLALFPYTEPWGHKLSQFLFSTFSGMLRSSVRALPDILVVIVIIIVARAISTLVRRIFGAIQKGEVAIGWLEPQAAKATGKILQVLIWVFTVIMAYPYLPGSNSDAFKGVSVFLGLLVSLGATSVVGQFTGGLVLMYSRALKPGEYVRIGDEEGTVLSVGFLSTKILTPRREEIHLPNLLLVGTSLKNYSRMKDREGVCLNTSITIGYNTPWRQVHGLLLRAVERTPGLRRDPPPFILQRALADFYVDYELNVTLDDPVQRVFALSALNANIQDLFNEYGVQIMSPHYLQDPPEKVWVPKKNWYEAPAIKEPLTSDPPPRAGGSEPAPDKA